MKVCMNGFRRNLSGEVRNLRDIVSDVVNGEFYDEQELADAVDDVIRSSNMLNCIYNEDDPDFVEMADVRVKTFEEI